MTTIETTVFPFGELSEQALRFMAEFVLLDPDDDDAWGYLSPSFNLVEQFLKDILKGYLAMLKTELEYCESDDYIIESGAMFNEDWEFQTWE